MEGKTGPGEDQHNEKNQEQDHGGILPIILAFKRKCETAPEGHSALRHSGPLWANSGPTLAGLANLRACR